MKGIRQVSIAVSLQMTPELQQHTPLQYFLQEETSLLVAAAR